MSQQEDTKPSPELESSLKKLKQIYEQEQRSYREFVDSIQGLQPLEKAECWLKYVADNDSTKDYGAQEALVYLVSRGYDCAERIRDLVSQWKLAAERSIQNCMREVRVYHVDTGEYGDVVETGMSYGEASDILSQSPYKLRDFWSGLDHQELSIDATMLRTVEWCHIGGFDEWWLRLAREHYEMATQGGVDPIPASFFLFNMCRSDYAIQIMHKALNRMLDAIELPEYKQPYPWQRWIWSVDPPQAVNHSAYAATVVFANERLRPHHINKSLVDQAIAILLKYQDNEGCWRCWANDKEPSLDTTAMAIHALALRRPRGWELAVSAAQDWFWSIQDRSGYWYDRGCPDSVYLTVLVLDALELAEGKSMVTFGLAKPSDRVAQESSREIERQSRGKIKALFLTANPSGTLKLSLDEQIRLITEKIRAAEYRDLLDLVSVWAVRADDLLQSLNEHKPHIVHFSGHGSQGGEILVVGQDGKPKPISTSAVKSLFTTLKDNIRIVILDACYSKSQAEAISGVVDCVIGMEGTIGQTAASIFTASFYRAIGFGRSVQEAFEQGITALLLEDIPEENAPNLLTRPGVDPSQVFLVPTMSE